MDYTYLPPSILNDLYEEPAKLEVLTFDDFLNLPLNDLYLKENGNDPASFAKYKPKAEEKKDDAPDPASTEVYEDSSEDAPCEDVQKVTTVEKKPVFSSDELKKLICGGKKC